MVVTNSHRFAFDSSRSQCKLKYDTLKEPTTSASGCGEYLTFLHVSWLLRMHTSLQHAHQTSLLTLQAPDFIVALHLNGRREEGEKRGREVEEVSICSEFLEPELLESLLAHIKFCIFLFEQWEKLLVKERILGDIQLYGSLGKFQFVQVIPGDMLVYDLTTEEHECICLCRHTSFVRSRWTSWWRLWPVSTHTGSLSTTERCSRIIHHCPKERQAQVLLGKTKIALGILDTDRTISVLNLESK